MSIRASSRHRAVGACWRAAVVMTGVATLALASPLRALEDRPLGPVPLLLIVYDRVGLSADTLADARRMTAKLYEDVGVAVDWFEYGSPAFERLLAGPDQKRLVLSRALFLSLVPVESLDGPASPPDVAGRALSGSRYAWVFVPRVASIAKDHRVCLGTLLGHVIAHELGHLLLPASGHSARGLMAARLDTRRLDRKQLCFDEDQGRLIRDRLIGIQTSEDPSGAAIPVASSRRGG